VSQIFRYKKFTLEYAFSGTGSQCLLAFHGYGRDASDFTPLQASLGKKYRIISIHLFGHQGSTVDQELVESGIKINEFGEMLGRFLRDLEINRFSLMGYSLGGKIAMVCTELFSERIDEVLLFAPDGFNRNPFYRFISQSRPGFYLYEKTGKTFFRFLSWIQKSSAVRSKLISFVHHHLETDEKRAFVLEIWKTYRHFRPNLKKIRQILQKNSVRMVIFSGIHDAIIRKRDIEKFVRKTKGRCTFVKISSGHRILSENLNAAIEKLIQ
jgi:pimeloyl-ACP methyl ester carboxylesterase